MDELLEAVVLVVDDDEVDRVAVVRALQHSDHPFRTVEATTAAEAVLRATVAKPDCIVLDHRLPTATAGEVLSLLEHEGIDAPVIVLTGIGDEKVAIELLKSGVRDCLPKGEFAPEQLARSVAHTIRLDRAEQASIRANARWRRHVAMLGQLAVVSPKLYASLTVEELLESAARSIREIFVARRAFLILRSAGEQPSRSALAGEPEDGSVSDAELPDGEEFWEALTEAEGTLCIDAPHFDGKPVQRLVAPIRKRDRTVVGAVAVDRYVDAEWEGQEADRAVLLQFSHMVSVAIENARLFMSERNAVLAREEILAIVSHDLRAPLGSVQLAGSLLRELVADEGEVGVVLDRLDAGVAHMQQLIEDLMDLARIDAGTLHIETAPTSVDQLVELATSLMESNMARKGVSLDQKVASPLPKVLADSKRVVQLLTNLLGNALKYSPRQGAVHLHVAARDNAVEFAVHDEGEGLNEEELSRLFDRFWQAERRSKRGLGLGLYIAKAIVDAHGGRIWAEHQQAGGACFKFTLPTVEKKRVSDPRPRGQRAQDRP